MDKKMLQDIRDNSQGVIAKVIVGLIIAIFALFGVDSIIGGFVASPSVAEVNGDEITEAELQANTQNLIASLGGNIEALDQDLLEQISLNQLIEELVMKQAAEQAEMTISSNRIDRNIIDTASFQINGQFDSDLAVRTMTSQGFSVPLYRETLSQQMLMAQVANAYASSNFVTNSELENLIKLTSQARDFRYLSVTLGARTLGTPITDAQIQAYYDANQEEFREDESVLANYVMLDKTVIADEITVDEETLLAQYEEERGAFEGSSEKRASHILFEVGADMTEDQALAAATAAKQRLDAGEDFAALALELSSDVISAEDGGDIGYTDGTAFPAELEAALGLLSLNEVSAAVITEFGAHLVLLTEDKENVYPAFEEVSGRIERELKSSEVELIYSERLADLSNLAFETADLLEISDQLGLPILQSQEFTRLGGNGIFSNPGITDAAFSDEVVIDGNNSELIELNDAQSVVLRVTQFNESSILPREDVEGQISVILRTQMEREAVRDLGNEVFANLENQEVLAGLLADNELEWVEAIGVVRTSNTVNRRILEEAFTLADPEDEPVQTTLILDNGTFVVMELTQVVEGTLDALPQAERASLTSRMISDLGNSDFQAYLGTLKKNADVKSRLADEAF
ncbi:MAG: peptidyl-prolyl cis-trans isomerase D [Pseudohongiellaceae bacterium]|jgi:peptidyl-prolyl cis-trans isomerase D